MSGPRRPDAATTSALAGAAVIGAQYVAAKTARDAYFLTHFEPTALPPMVIGTSVFAILLVAALSTRLSTISPRRYVPATFAVNAVLLLGIWGMTAMPRIAAPLLYLLVSGAGPMLGSGFWLLASERFDPRGAKRRFGQIGAAGTLGGLLGGVMAARLTLWMGLTAVIPLLAVMNFVCAWQTWSWARQAGDTATDGARAPVPARSGFRLLKEHQYLRNLALVMLLATVAAALMDYVFKVQVTGAFDRGPQLARFFAIYYAVVSVITFAVQAFASRPILEQLGLSAAMSAVPLSVFGGATAAIVNPVLPMFVAVRGIEAALHGSLLRAGYEVFYTPIAAEDKRAVKAVIDVGTDRIGDLGAALTIQLLLWSAFGAQAAVLLGLAALCGAVALLLANRVNRGYIVALEHSLRSRAVDIDAAGVVDHQTRTMIGGLAVPRDQSSEAAAGAAGTPADVASISTELELREIRQLRSRDPASVQSVLHRDDLLPATLVPEVIKLLEHDEVADEAARALRGVAEHRVGELIDTLTDPSQPFAVRRRLARVFSVCSSQRAADGLMQGLDDKRFEVRVQCGRSLAAIVERNPRVRIDAPAVSAVVLREVKVSRHVWESRRIVDEHTQHGAGTFDALVGERANRALAHVFTLLGLFLAAQPLRIAYRGLHTTDKALQGTSLEYLEQVLPRDIRDGLWPFLEAGSAAKATPRPREEILADLMRSNQSIVINLEQITLRR